MNVKQLKTLLEEIEDEEKEVIIKLKDEELHEDLVKDIAQDEFTVILYNY